MSQYTGLQAVKSFTSGATHARGIRVKLSSGVTAAAVLADNNWIGVTQSAVVNSGDPVSVVLRAPTMQMTAAAAITAGAFCYTAASGKVSTTATGAFLVGVALTASTADGDIIEVMPLSGDTAQ